MIKKFILSILIIIVAIVGALIYYKHVDYIQHNHYIDIDNLVKEGFTSKNGYDDNMQKHMSQRVFNALNAYPYYTHDKQPIKVVVKLNEINQHKINGKIFVYMIYDFEVYDADGKLVSGSWQSPIIFTVTDKENNLYIEKSQEFEIPDEVPKMYR
jgi:uncharacterized protein YxeA